MCDVIALFIYIPFILLAMIFKFIFRGDFYKSIPLSYYLDKSWKIIRNDSLDRFGTPLEKRYSKKEIEYMMGKVGLTQVLFSENPPYWHVVGQRLI